MGRGGGLDGWVGVRVVAPADVCSEAQNAGLEVLATWRGAVRCYVGL